MGDTGSIDPIELTGEIVEKTLDSEPVRNLLGPLTKNIGQIFGLVTDIARFYTEENLAHIFSKWAKQRNGEPLDPDSFRRVLPLLRDAAMQSDDELQERWASLLESIAKGRQGTLPSFGQTLSQLTSEEARYLDKIWEFVTGPKPFKSGKRYGRDALSYSNLLHIYKPQLQPPSPAEARYYRNRLSAQQLADYDEMTNFELILHDLERLSLLEKNVEYSPGTVTRIDIGGEALSLASGDGGTRIRYSLTQYGVNFISAVRAESEGR